MNGTLTLGENIADLGGSRWRATRYRKALADAGKAPDETIDGSTRDQRFFLNWATVWRRNYKPEDLRVRLRVDPHAPANFRAIGGPSNLVPFAGAFGCAQGDADGASRGRARSSSGEFTR